MSQIFCKPSYLQSSAHSYLQNGNILAARTFITHFASALPKDLQASSIAVGSTDEIIMTKDAAVNFAQIAVLTCQRAQGDKSKVMRESWIRLCGTYQSRGGILASPEVRKVNKYIDVALHSLPLSRFDFIGAQRTGDVVLCNPASSESTCEPVWRDAVYDVWWTASSTKEATTESVSICGVRLILRRR